MVALLVFLTAIPCSLAMESSRSLADAVHAIANKCHTREEYDNCSNYATTGLASCGPDDRICKRASIFDILDYCDDVCGFSDYMPFAVAYYLESNDYSRLVTREERSSSQEGTFVVGKKTFTASEVIDALALKQFVETRDRPMAPSHMVEDRLKPAVSNIRDSLQQQLLDTQHLKNNELESGDLARESQELVTPRHKRLSNGGGISNSFQIRLKDPQTGKYLPAIGSYRYGSPIYSYSDEEIADPLGFSADSQSSLLSDDLQPPWRYIEPTKDRKSLVYGIPQQSRQREQYSHSEPHKDDKTVILYQDVKPSSTAKADKYSLAAQDEIDGEAELDREAKQRWGNKVKSLFNIHAAGKESATITSAETQQSAATKTPSSTLASNSSSTLRSNGAVKTSSSSLASTLKPSTISPETNGARSTALGLAPICCLMLFFILA